MPTIFSHAVAGAAVAAVLAPAQARKPIMVAAAICAMLPDADAIGFRFGVAYGSEWGHRGMTHSLLFAIVVGAVAALIVARPPSRLRAFLSLAVATASHPILDMFTSGGMGVALLAPFDDTRFFFPWRPIRVSPIGIRQLLTARFARVLVSEFVWVWLPSIAIGALWLNRKARLGHQ